MWASGTHLVISWTKFREISILYLCVCLCVCVCMLHTAFLFSSLVLNKEKAMRRQLFGSDGRRSNEVQRCTIVCETGVCSPLNLPLDTLNQHLIAQQLRNWARRLYHWPSQRALFQFKNTPFHFDVTVFIDDWFVIRHSPWNADLAGLCGRVLQALGWTDKSLQKTNLSLCLKTHFRHIMRTTAIFIEFTFFSPVQYNVTMWRKDIPNQTEVRNEKKQSDSYLFCIEFNL